MSKKIVAIVGSYRKGGTIDRAVEAILDGAKEQGAQTHTIYLTDHHIEFCTNCRQCAQTPGAVRGQCVQHDDLEPMLQEIEAADAVVLASPVNYYNVTAVYRRFLERLLGFAYWPPNWMPAPRAKQLPRKAVLVSSAAMPGFLIPLATGATKALRVTAKMLGAKPVGCLWIGLATLDPHHALTPRTLDRARRMGMKLA
jgi:multimeric flavodoxin WrbA